MGYFDSITTFICLQIGPTLVAFELHSTDALIQGRARLQNLP